jgi:hypothetical protein
MILRHPRKWGFFYLDVTNSRCLEDTDVRLALCRKRRQLEGLCSGQVRVFRPPGPASGVRALLEPFQRILED